MRISLYGEELAKMVGAGSGTLAAFKTGRRYDLARVHLLRLGCPRELAASRENKLNLPLVVEKNRHHFGREPQSRWFKLYGSGTNFYPQVVVVCGEYRRGQLLAHGALDDIGWVERGSMPLADNDVIHCGELAEQLQAQVAKRYYTSGQPIKGQAWPCIAQINPFDNYCVYEIAGSVYRQGYAIDAERDELQLVGGAVKLNGYSITSGGTPGMAQSQTGGKFPGIPLPLSCDQVIRTGGFNCDLVRMMIRDTSSETNVVQKMLDAMKNGLYKPLKPDFAPVNLSDDGKILGPLVQAGISPADFVVWADKYMESREFSQDKRKSLAKKGEALPGGGFPIVNREDLANAKRALGRAKNRAATIRHINKRAKALGAPGLGESSSSSEGEVDAFGNFKKRFGGFKHSPKMHDVGGPKRVAFKV